MTNPHIKDATDYQISRLNRPALEAVHADIVAMHADIVAVILSHVTRTDLDARDLHAYFNAAADGARITAAFAREDRESLIEKLRYELDTVQEAVKGL